MPPLHISSSKPLLPHLQVNRVSNLMMFFAGWRKIVRIVPVGKCESLSVVDNYRWFFLQVGIEHFVPNSFLFNFFVFAGTGRDFAGPTGRAFSSAISSSRLLSAALINSLMSIPFVEVQLVDFDFII